MRKAFTLIEMMIAIVILSIVMIFLYKTYAMLNQSNKFYRTKINKIKLMQTKERIITLDFMLMIPNTLHIHHIHKNQDIVFFQTINSIHRRFYPYIAYIDKNHKLYRLESSIPFIKYPLSINHTFDVDYLGAVYKFNIYSSTKNPNNAIVSINFKNHQQILLNTSLL